MAEVAGRLRDSDRHVLTELERAWLLVLDDAGAEHDVRSGFIPAKLYDLCKTRLER